MAVECYQQLDLSSATLVLKLWLRKNSEARLKYNQNLFRKSEVEEMSHGGSEPAGLDGLREQVTEAKKGPWSLVEGKAKRTPKGRRWGQWERKRETEREKESCIL